MATNAAELTMLIRARDEAQATLSRVEGHLKRIEGGINGVLGTAAKLGGAVTAIRGLGDAFSGTAAGITGVVREASDVSESINKIGVVFGQAGGAVQRFADDSSTALGLSRRNALEALGTFGNLFTAMGIGEGRAADMSKQLVTLASDLASFNNIPIVDALEKLRSGLVGETEPLRTVGVNLNQATIEAKAMELGILRVGEELTAAGKAQAAYALILEQTRSAQGDFARTADGLANSTRILEARFSDLKARVGEALLPLATQGVSTLNDFFAALDRTGAVDNFRDGLRQRAAAVQSFISDVRGLVEGEGLNVLDATLTAIADRLRTGFGEQAGRGFEVVTRAVGDLSNTLGTFLSTQLVPGITQVGNFALALYEAGRSGQSFQQSLGGAGGVLDGLRGVLERVTPVLRDHKELFAGLATSIGLLVVASRVVPIVAGLSAAITALSAAFAAGGTVAGISAIVTLLGGPLALALAGAAVALGVLTAAWIGNWGDIQTKTEVAVRVISRAIAGLQTQVQTTQAQMTPALDGISKLFGMVALAVERATATINAQLATWGLSFQQVATQAARWIPVVGGYIALIQDRFGDLRQSLEDVGREVEQDRINRTIEQGMADQERRQREFVQNYHAETEAIVRENARRAQSAQEQAEFEERIRQLQLQASQSGGTTSFAPARKDREERERERAKTAIEGFIAELQRDAVTMERMFGELGGRAATALSEALAENTEAAGAALGRAIQDLTREAERSGIPDFQELADALAGSFHDALVDRGNPALRAAALENLRAFTETLRQANALSPESFARAFDTAALRQQLGSGGQQIMAALETAIREGGAQNIRALAEAVAGMRAALFDDRELSPERAREVWTQIWRQVNSAIAQGTAEAQRNLMDFFRELNFNLQVEKLGQATADRINEALDEAFEAIAEAARKAREQIDETLDQFNRARSLRGQRQEIERANEEALRQIEAHERRANEIRQRARENDAVQRRRAFEDEDRDRRRAEEIEDLRRRQREQRATTSLGLGGAPRVGVSPLDDPGHRAQRELRDLERRWQREDEQRNRQRAREDEDRLKQQGQQDTDRARELAHAETLRRVREQQRVQLQAFEDKAANADLARRIRDIQTAEAEAVNQANRRLGEIRNREESELNRALERIYAQQEAWDAVLDGYLADLDEANIRIEKLRLSKLGEGGALDEEGAGAVINRGQLALPVGAGAAGSRSITVAPVFNMYGPVVGQGGMREFALLVTPYLEERLVDIIDGRAVGGGASSA